MSKNPDPIPRPTPEPATKLWNRLYFDDDRVFENNKRRPFHLLEESTKQEWEKVTQTLVDILTDDQTKKINEPNRITKTTLQPN